MRFVLLSVYLFTTSLAFTSLTGCSGKTTQSPSPSLSTTPAAELQSGSKTSDVLTESQILLKVSNLYVDTGRAYYERKRYDEAIFEYTKAIEKTPNNVQAYYHRSIAYYKSDNTSELDKAEADA